MQREPIGLELVQPTENHGDSDREEDSAPPMVAVHTHHGDQVASEELRSILHTEAIIIFLKSTKRKNIYNKKGKENHTIVWQ